MRNNLKIIHVNLMKSSEATESLLELAIEFDVSILLIQEPKIIKNTSSTGEISFHSINHPAFTQILPSIANQVSLDRVVPRTLAYVKKNIQNNLQVSMLSDIISDPDCMVLRVQTSGQQFYIYNIYNQSCQQRTIQPKTFERILWQKELLRPGIIVGDFNMHHPSWDPGSSTSSGADRLIEWADANELCLLNSPGEGTFFRPHMTRETVIDLSYSSSHMANRIDDWQILPSVGSDHKPIYFTIQTEQNAENLIENPVTASKFNTKNADWIKFRDKFRSLIRESNFFSSETYKNLSLLNSTEWPEVMDRSPNIKNVLDLTAKNLTECIYLAAISSIPQIKPGGASKPWWNENLKNLRREMMRTQRACIAGQDLGQKYCEHEDFKKSRNSYMRAIKEAKKEHWNKFLEKEDPKSIFKAMAYTKGAIIEPIPSIRSKDGYMQSSFEGKANAFRETLFPRPPESDPIDLRNSHNQTYKWPRLGQFELEQACLCDIKGKTPGPDAINQDMIREAYISEPAVFFQIYSLTFNLGYHPESWREATGAVLKKNGKPDYSIPKAYRVISLLNCLGKVLERIFAKRLSTLAETTHLLDKSQIGGRLRKSAIDAAMILTDEIQTNKQHNRKTSTLLLDIKGAFDHVAKNRLLEILKRTGLPLSLLSWVKSFLSNRRLRLAFDGQIETFKSIETGIPQGSPVSPILFLIYIRDLFQSNAVKFISYIDDIAMTVSSTSLKKNVKILEREAKNIYTLGSYNGIEFDLDKTELIHFTSSKESKNTHVNLPNNKQIRPKTLVRWLGFWFDDKLTFKQHLAIRVAQAKNAFFRMCRLANINVGLSPRAIRQIYMACIVSVSDYGSPVWWKNQTSFRYELEKLQNLATRKILGVFKTAPAKVLEIEACLIPPAIRLDEATRNYALRTRLLSQSHPITSLINRQYPEDTYIAKPTQLERAFASVQSIWASNPEIIKFHKTKPWRKKPSYIINIERSSKEEIVTIHQRQFDKDLGKKVLYVYTDASSRQEGGYIGIGFTITDMFHNRTIYRAHKNMGQNQLVYNGELEAIASALERIEEGNDFANYQIKIFSDSKAALYRLKSYSEKSGQSHHLRIMKSSKHVLSKGIVEISLSWVPGHSNIKGNIEADTLAKMGTEDPPNEVPTSQAFIRAKSRQITSDNWFEDFSKYKEKAQRKNPSTYAGQYPVMIKRKMSSYQKVERKIISAFYQLKVGHGYFKSYLHRIKMTTSDRCPCNGSTKQTPRHLILECKYYKNERRTMMQDIGISRPTMAVLFQTSKGTKAMLDFISKTKISTRDWYLNAEQQAEDIGMES